MESPNARWKAKVAGDGLDAQPTYDVATSMQGILADKSWRRDNAREVGETTVDVAVASKQSSRKPSKKKR